MTTDQFNTSVENYKFFWYDIYLLSRPHNQKTTHPHDQKTKVCRSISRKCITPWCRDMIYRSSHIHLNYFIQSIMLFPLLLLLCIVWIIQRLLVTLIDNRRGRTGRRIITPHHASSGALDTYQHWRGCKTRTLTRQSNIPKQSNYVRSAVAKQKNPKV